MCYSRARDCVLCLRPPPCLTSAGVTDSRLCACCPAPRIVLRQALGDAACIAGTCTCRIWSPRERHVATTFNDNIYILGGVTWVETQMCGKLACGGGYRHFLNDVWRTVNGLTWEQVSSKVRSRTRASVCVVGARVADLVASVTRLSFLSIFRVVHVDSTLAPTRGAPNPTRSAGGLASTRRSRCRSSGRQVVASWRSWRRQVRC